MSSGGWREVFEERCLNCRRKLRILITNEATEMWGGICKCGYRNIFTSSYSGGYDQRIERVKDGKFKRH
jgi:hypothetical protein